MTDPGSLTVKLEGIENDLAERQNRYEEAAAAWFKLVPRIEKNLAIAYREAPGGPTDKKEAAKALREIEGAEEKAAYEALRVVVKVLEQRSMILMALLKSQGHV
ncbi:MAG TPA: hypothetical protein VMT20_07210 [Terriglobia bacterium]|nr:hypothetical protein [Terriglobia bacterium]